MYYFKSESVWSINELLALVTPEIKNLNAIACYQKAGFMPCLTKEEAHELWLIAKIR